MATWTVNTVSGGDYSSLAAAVADLPATLEEPYVIECSGATTDTVGVEFSGFTTTETNSLTVTGNLTAGIWDDDNYTISRTSGSWYTLDMQTSHVWIKYLQISGGDYGIVLFNTATTNAGLDSCYIKNTANKSAVTNGIAINTITQGIDGTTTAHHYRYMKQLDNCICLHTSGRSCEGWNTSANTTGPRNCYFSSNTTTNTWGVNFQYCLFAGSVPSTGQSNTGSSGDHAAADIFVDAANGDFRLKSGSPAIGAGADLSDDFTTDITGATRTTPWDIGAFMFKILFLPVFGRRKANTLLRR